jgi:2-amino-4-hydroxy-6-hydroxymethyldihydropteridine diphosphokinase
MSNIYLSIGGNQGARLTTLANCRKLINEKLGNIIKESSIFMSEAWGFTDPKAFLNQVINIETTQTPEILLLEIHKIEKELGRIRYKDSSVTYHARTIDIDILLYDQRIINKKDLIVPHPHMENRNFVMIPLAEIAPETVHPVLNKTFKTLQSLCPDKSRIRKLTSKNI